MPTLGEITALLDEWFPPHHADDWDAVGLVLGDPAVDVRRILLAVDPVAAVADEAVLHDADLLVTHHPLFLKGVHGFAATDPKGRVAHRLLSNGCALFTAHTNADSPAGGVSESLALALGLEDVRPLEADPAAGARQDRRVRPGRRRRAGAGGAGGRRGRTRSATTTRRRSPRRARDASVRSTAPTPAIGEVGRAEVVDEVRIETVCPRSLRDDGGRGDAGGASLRGAGVRRGRAGRARRARPWLGPDRPAAVADDAARVRGARRRRCCPRPRTAYASPGTRTQLVEPVGLCGGAGDFLLDRARAAGVDVYLTSDLRHHPASELREHGDAPALVDVAHWAAESTWLPVLRDRLVAALGEGRYGGGAREHDQHRPVDLPGLRSHRPGDPF